MNLIFAAVGAILGAMMFHSMGLVFGTVAGWLWGTLYELQKRHAVVEKDLSTLRRSLDSHAGVSIHPVAEESDILQLTDADVVHDEPAVSFTYKAPPPPPREEVCAESTWKWSQEKGACDEPSPLEETLRNLFSGENLLVKLGVVILFFGVAFLVKYAAQHGLFPIELRLSAAALGGCALLGVGWWLRSERPVYAQVIQGGGIGILYLTTYGAMRLYHLISLTAGFGLLVIICFLAGILAVLQDSHTLAVMGSAGGFLAPELASIGNGSHVVLFSYYALLNAGIFGIARYRAWRSLNLLGFFATFVGSVAWGARYYQPAHFLTVEPFLILYFLCYTAVAVLYARRFENGAHGFVDGTLVFGAPVVGFLLQAALVRDFEYGMAWSAFALGLFYIVSAARLFRSDPEHYRYLAEAFLAFGAVFTTLAIPLAFDGRWTAAAWSLEGAALIWIGLRQDRILARMFGYLLLFGSGVAFLVEAGTRTGSLPVLNGFYLGCLLIAWASLFSAYLLHSADNSISADERHLEMVLFCWGMIWWFLSGLHEIADHTLASHVIGTNLVFFAVSCGACLYLGRRLTWRLLDWVARGLLPVMVVTAVLQGIGTSHYPSDNGGWFGWPLTFVVWYLIPKYDEHQEQPWSAALYAVPFWLVSLLMSWEISGRIINYLPAMASWAVIAWGAVPALGVLVVSRRGERLPWPVSANFTTYLGVGCIPLALFAWLWVWYVNLTQSGNPWPLPYLPIVNPLDGSILLVLVSLTAWYRAMCETDAGLTTRFPHREARIAFTATLFLWLNAVLLRSIHHWCGVAFTPEALFASQLVQATLSIVWSLTAFAIMTLATRLNLRHLWVTGAGLLGTVVVKLFLVDLAGHGSISRIVSFVVVGLLMLVIGWYSPVPPHAHEGGAA